MPTACHVLLVLPENEVVSFDRGHETDSETEEILQENIDTVVERNLDKRARMH